MADNLTGRIIRGYEMLEQIGAGGFGAVYRASQPILKREVAIKVVLPEYANSPDFVRRFEVEAELVARLEHPYIVPLFDYWREPDSAYLVMRLLRGGTLQGLLEEGNPLPLDRITTILDQISSALHVSHRNNVVHRDIKPANILLDEDGNAFLTDFGIAQSKDYESLSGDDDGITGSISHTPPEQIQSGVITPRTDIYAVGVILYQMLTGEHPYKDTTLSQMIFKHLQEPIPDLERDDLPFDINDIVQKATAKDPDDRYADVRDLANEFKALVSGASSLPMMVEDEVIIFTDIENPYKGLRAFQEADADQFFGRDNLVDRLLDRMAEPVADARLLAVIGPSGSGKSSVVKAGLLPAIRNGRLRNSDNWFIVEMFPSAAPFKELERALMKVAVNPVEELIREVGQENGLSRVVNSILPDDNSELVLVIDQFEELFTQVEDEDIRARFLNNLVDSVQADDSRLRLIITMRADFYDKPLQYREFGELLRKRIETVLPMSPNELVETIIRPAQSVGIDFQAGLVEAISQDVGEQAGMLPLLQYTMTELFDNRQGNTLTLAAYQDIGGVAGSLARRSEDIYTGLPAFGQAAARQLFLRLVSLGEGTEDTRRRVRRTELATTEAIGDVIDLYGRYRLLTFDKDPQSREPTVEVAHEALIRTWERLREWINDNREDLRVQRRVSSAVAEWNGSGKDASFLASGARLTQFQEWRDTTDLILNNDEQTYIQASLEAETARKAEELRIARRVQNFQRAAAALGVMVVVAIIATGVLLSQAQSAQRNANNAIATLEPAQTQVFQAQSLADGAETQVALAQTDAQAAELAVVSAQEQATLAQNDLSTAQSLAGNAQTQAAVSNLLTEQAPTVQAAEGRVADLEAQVESVGATLTPAQQEIESAQMTVAAAQTDVSSAQIEAQDAQNQVADSQTEVAVAEIGISTSEAEALVAQNQVATAQAEVAIAENGILTSEAEAAIAQNLVATSQADAENAQNQVATSQAEAELAQTDVFSAVEEAQNAQADANEAQTSVALAGQTQTPVAATVIAGAQQLADQQDSLSTAVALAGNAQTQIAVQDQLTQVAPTLAAADALVANLQQTLEPAQATIDAVDIVIQGIEQEVETARTEAAFVQSEAASIRLAVNAEQALELGDFDLALALTFESLELDPNQTRARRILNEVAFGTARISVAETRVGKLSADSQFFVVSDGNDLIVWDVATRTLIQQFAAHDADILDIDFSDDGTRMATASADTTARIWDIMPWRSGASAIELHTLQQHTGAVNVVRFGLNDRLFTGSEDSNIIEWAVSNGSVVREYTGNTWAVRDLTFVGDGSNFFTTVDANGTLILLYWNVGNVNPRFTENSLIFQQFNDAATRSILGGRNGQPLTIYNTTSRQVVRPFTSGFNWHTESATAFDFNPENATAMMALSASQGGNRLVEVDIATGAILRSFSVDASERIDVLAFDPSGTLLLSSSENILTLWDVQAGTALRTLAAHTDIITAIEWSDDGQYAVSRSRDNNVRLWDVTGADEALRAVYEIETTLNRGKFPGFSSSGDVVMTAAWVSMFSWEQATDIRRQTVSADDEILNIIYTPVESRAITVLPRVALVWDINAGANGRGRTYGDNNSQFTGAAAYSPNGEYIVLDEPNRILVYEIATGNRQTINKPTFDEGREVTSIAVSPDGQYVVASVGVKLQQEASVGEIVMWDAQANEILYRFPVEHNRNINWVTFSADGNQVLSASDDNTLIIWRVSPQGAELFRRFAGHIGDVNLGRFVPNDGNSEQFIISASDDRTMILWDINSGQALRTYRGSPASITGFNISADGTQMVTTYGVLDPALSRTEPVDGSAETIVYVWALTDADQLVEWTATNRYIRPFTPAECDQYNISDCNAEFVLPQSSSNTAPITPPTTVASNSNDSTDTSASDPTAVVVSEDAPTAINNGSVNLNVRGSDTTNASVVGNLAVGESATILGRSNRNTRWYQVRLDNGQVGWVRNDLVNISGDTTALPDVNPPVVAAPPTSAPVTQAAASEDESSTPVTTSSSNANLQITGIGFVPNPPQCAQAFTVQLNITNTGTEATTSDATVFASDRHVATGSQGPSSTGTVPPLAPNQNWVVEISLTVTTFFAEEHQVSAQVDSGGTIPESNETDNFSSANYVLGSGTC